MDAPSKLLSIRPFDVQSQRTGEEFLDSLILLPGSEVIFNEKSLSQAQRKLHQIRSEFKGPQLQQLEKKLHSADRFPGLEHLAPLFYETLESIFDYLPENHLLLVDENQKIRERSSHFFNEIFMEYEQGHQQKRITLPTGELYLSHRQMQSRIVESCFMMISEEKEETASDAKKSSENIIDFDLKTAIEEFANKVGFPIGRIDVMDGSKRSAHSNAYFSGFGKSRRIALFDTLLDKHSTEEIVSVVAHEIGHYKKKHIITGTVLGVIETCLLYTSPSPRDFG